MIKTSCAICGYNKNMGSLHIHHLDHDHNNNSEDNLVVWCSNCHMEYHQRHPKNKQKKIKQKEPARIMRNEQLVETSEKEILEEENSYLKYELERIKSAFDKKDRFFLDFLKELPDHMDGFFYKNERIVNNLYEKMYIEKYK